MHATLGAQVASDPATRGAKISGLVSGGPVAAAGLCDGVVITKVDGQVIDGPDALIAAVSAKAPGDKVTLTYVDPAGATRTTQVILGTVEDSH